LVPDVTPYMTNLGKVFHVYLRGHTSEATSHPKDREGSSEEPPKDVPQYQAFDNACQHHDREAKVIDTHFRQEHSPNLHEKTISEHCQWVQDSLDHF
jgi:hypothetical protein